MKMNNGNILSELRNGKYFAGKMSDFKKTKGWFVGSFFEEGNPCKTDKIEMLYRIHNPGDVSEKHYHQEKIELIIILDGEAKYFINDNLIVLKKGDFLFVDINNTVEAKFEKKCELLAVHSPSNPTDKVRLE